MNNDYKQLKLKLTTLLNIIYKTLDDNIILKRKNVLVLNQIEQFIKIIKEDTISYEQLCYLYNILYHSDTNITGIFYDNNKSMIYLITTTRKGKLQSSIVDPPPKIITRMIEKSKSYGDIKDTMINLYKPCDKIEVEKVINYSLKEGIEILTLKTKRVTINQENKDNFISEMIENKDYSIIEHRSVSNPSCKEILDIDGNTYEVQEDFDSENRIKVSTQKRNVMKELISLSKMKPEKINKNLKSQDDLQNTDNIIDFSNIFYNKEKKEEDPDIEEFYKNMLNYKK